MILVNKGIAHPWECDIQGHWTTRFYIGLFDDASYHFLHEVFGSIDGMGWADVHQEVDYLNEVEAGDLLEVHACLQKIGGKSLVIEYLMTNLSQDNQAARVVTTSVFFDLQARKAVALTEAMREAGTPHLLDSP